MITLVQVFIIAYANKKRYIGAIKKEKDAAMIYDYYNILTSGIKVIYFKQGNRQELTSAIAEMRYQIYQKPF